MKKIPVEEIEDGMVLAGEVFGPEGNSLLGEGTVLSERHRSLLGKRGIEMVSIVAEDDEPVSDLPPESECSTTELVARTEIERVFSACGQDESMAMLKAMALARAGRIKLSV
ncbi:MAG: hypothetical protein ACYTGH_09665 [Planctomycetota bacterium]